MAALQHLQWSSGCSPTPGTHANGGPGRRLPAKGFDQKHGTHLKREPGRQLGTLPPPVARPVVTQILHQAGRGAVDARVCLAQWNTRAAEQAAAQLVL